MSSSRTVASESPKPTRADIGCARCPAVALALQASTVRWDGDAGIARPYQSAAWEGVVRSYHAAGQIRSCWNAYVVAAVRDDTPSLAKMFWRCRRTVWSLTTSAAA